MLVKQPGCAELRYYDFRSRVGFQGREDTLWVPHAH